VLGGTNWKDNTKHWLDEMWTFDTAVGEWRAFGKLPHRLTCAVISEWKGDLILAGGFDSTQPCNEVWRIKPKGTVEPEGKLSCRSAAAMGGVIDDSLVFVGGCANPSDFQGPRNDAQQLQLKSGTTSPIPFPPLDAFCLGANVVAGSELFIFGGATLDASNQTVNLNKAWAYSPSKGWRTLRPLPVFVRGAAAVVLDKRHILVAGGYGGDPENFLSTAFIYDREKDAYSRTTDLPIPAITALARAGDFVYVLGGEDRMKHRTDECFRVKVKELLESGQKTR
jgi:N-acetylneuraminic acid mutarotase